MLSLFVWAVPCLGAPARWKPVEPRDYWITAGLGAASLYANSKVKTSDIDRWSEPGSLDLRARNRFRLDTIKGRSRAGEWSDITLRMSVAIPVAIAPGIVWSRDNDPSLAGQIVNIDAQSFALNGLLTASFKSFIGRERPYARACRADPNEDPVCKATDRSEFNRSFFSGHASYAFTAAGLACLHATDLELLGSGGDSALCAGAVALALVTAGLRMSADQHYLSDVAAGAGSGLLSGYVFPQLLHSTQEKQSRGSGSSALILSHTVGF